MKIKDASQNVLLFTIVAISLATYKLVSIASKIFKKKKKKEYFCELCGEPIGRGNGVYIYTERAYYFCVKCVEKGGAGGSLQG